MNLFASCSSSSKDYTQRIERRRVSSKAGFSLLELAIVLMILGIIGGLSLPLLTAHMTRTAFLKTRAHQEYVLSAIAAYVEKNRRFPCPAESHMIGAHFGVSQDSCRMEKARGIIPFKTLGMSKIYAYDGFKRLMTYVVEPELAKSQVELKVQGGGLITIKDEEGFSVLLPPKKLQTNEDFIALVLISHGESGVGAYIGKGQIGKVAGHMLSPQKKENSDDNFVFMEGGPSGDMLRWESRNLFLQHYVRFIK